MPKYDLAGNPLPEDPASEVRYDLAGNPLPSGHSPAPPPPGSPPPGPQYPQQLGVIPPQYAPPPGSAPPPPMAYPGGATPPPAYPGSVPPPYNPSSGTYPGAPQGAPLYRPIAGSKIGVDNKKIYVGLGIAAACIVFAVILLRILVPAHVPAPTGFYSYSAADRSFSCDAPLDWDKTSAEDATPGVESAVGGVLFKRGNARIDITTGDVSQLKADILMSSGAALPDGITSGSAEAMHKMYKSKVSIYFANYQEQPMETFGSNMGEACLSEWTADGPAMGFRHKMHGYRVSMVGSVKTAFVVCQCSDDDWMTLRPAFVHVMNSIQEGNLPKDPGGPLGVTMPPTGGTSIPADGAPSQ
jgi:hypothetical protein